MKAKNEKVCRHVVTKLGHDKGGAYFNRCNNCTHSVQLSDKQVLGSIENGMITDCGLNCQCLKNQDSEFKVLALGIGEEDFDKYVSYLEEEDSEEAIKN